MKKLRIEDLSVESFATSAALGLRGTVAGQEDSFCTGILSGCNTNEESLAILTCPNGTSGSDLAPCGTGTHGPGGDPTLQGESCNYTCNFRQCATGQPETCNGEYSCLGDTNGLQMC